MKLSLKFRIGTNKEKTIIKPDFTGRVQRLQSMFNKS